MSDTPTLRDFYTELGDGQGPVTAALELAEADARARGLRVDAEAALSDHDTERAAVLATLALADETAALRHAIAAASFTRPAQTIAQHLTPSAAPVAGRAFGEGIDLTDPSSFTPGAL